MSQEDVDYLDQFVGKEFTNPDNISKLDVFNKHVYGGNIFTPYVVHLRNETNEIDQYASLDMHKPNLGDYIRINRSTTIEITKAVPENIFALKFDKPPISSSTKKFFTRYTGTFTYLD